MPGWDEDSDCFFIQPISWDDRPRESLNFMRLLTYNRCIEQTHLFSQSSWSTWVGEASISAAPLSVEDYAEEDTDEALGSVVAALHLERCCL
ncbi:hypothetical protein Tco_0721869 [Tanacetum coccineum]